MKTVLIFGGVIAAVIGLGFLTAGRKLQNLTFKLISNVKYVPQSGLAQNLSQQKLSIDAAIDNPSKSKITFKSFLGSAYMDGRKLCDIKIDKQLDIPPQTTANLRNIVLTIPTVNLLSEISTILSNIYSISTFSDNVKSYLNNKVINVKGVLQAEGFTYPVDESSKIKM